MELKKPYRFPHTIVKERHRHCEPTGRANARPTTGSAKQSIPSSRLDGLLRCARNDGGYKFRVLAARIAPELLASEIEEGAGNAGWPMQPRVRLVGLFFPETRWRRVGAHRVRGARPDGRRNQRLFTTRE
jgi:hypothetical protein